MQIGYFRKTIDCASKSRKKEENNEKSTTINKKSGLQKYTITNNKIM